MTTVFKPKTTDVLVFKTNIRYKKDISRVAPLLSQRKRYTCWNVDLGDIDKVLRIEAEELTNRTSNAIDTAGQASNARN